jgi:hypothetical protein
MQASTDAAIAEVEANARKKSAKKAVTRKAPPKAGESGFDWQEDYPGEEVFVFTASDGTTVGLAVMSGDRRPKPGMLRKLRKQPALEQMWTVIEIVASENALAVSDEFTDKDYSEMYRQWTEYIGITPGE